MAGTNLNVGCAELLARQGLASLAGRALAPAMRTPDYKQYINLYNILPQKGQRTVTMYLMMTHT